nr:hypothetical protein [Methanobacterium formicicum]
MIKELAGDDEELKKKNLKTCPWRSWNFSRSIKSSLKNPREWPLVELQGMMMMEPRKGKKMNLEISGIFVKRKKRW